MPSFTDHSRNSAGLNYIYPVISRRAGGLSIGINLNTNNACNWRCIYCQVPELQRGKPSAIDFDLLEQELRNFLIDILHGDFYLCHNIPPEHRNIRDIAISGNGEPTSAEEFDRIVELIGCITDKLGLLDHIKLVLITNGSLMQRSTVQNAITHLSTLNGEVWFKLDSATNVGIRYINNVNLSIEKVRKNLEAVTKLCPTWIQTCVFGLDGKPPSDRECESYVEFLADVMQRGFLLQGVLLYGIARPSTQPEAKRLTRLPADWLEQYAGQIRQTGIEVKISA